MRSSGKRPLTRNLRFCFQWLPWAFVAICASVTTRISSHSSCVGSGRSHTVFCSSSRRRRSRFSSISFRLARRLLSSNTTGGTTRCLQDLCTISVSLTIKQIATFCQCKESKVLVLTESSINRGTRLFKCV